MLPCGRTDAITRRCSATALRLCSVSPLRQSAERRRPAAQFVCATVCASHCVASRRADNVMTLSHCSVFTAQQLRVFAAVSRILQTDVLRGRFLLPKRELTIHSFYKLFTKLFIHFFTFITLRLLFNNVVDIIPILKLRPHDAMKICIIIIFEVYPVNNQSNTHTQRLNRRENNGLQRTSW